MRSWAGLVANRVAVVGAVALVALAVVATRATVAGRAELARGLTLLSEDTSGAAQLEDAILHLRRAASWGGLPGTGVQDRALRALEDLARAAEDRGERELALHAWRSAAAGMMAHRSALLPDVAGSARFRRAVAGVRRLAGDREADALAAPGESAPGVLLTVFGFAAWVAGAGVFLVRGFDELGRLRRPLGRTPSLALVAVVVGFAAFLVGLGTA